MFRRIFSVGSRFVLRHKVLTCGTLLGGTVFYAVENQNQFQKQISHLLIPLSKIPGVSTSALGCSFMLSRDSERLDPIWVETLLENIGIVLDDQIEALQSSNSRGKLKRKTYYALACLSNLAHLSYTKQILFSEPWLNRLENLIKLQNQSNYSSDWNIILGSVLAAVVIHSLNDQKQSLVHRGFSEWFQGKMLIPGYQLNPRLQTTQLLVKDIHTKPIVDDIFGYFHQPTSAASSWEHYLDSGVCKNYLLLFGTLFVAELANCEGAREDLLTHGVLKTYRTLLTSPDLDSIILPQFIRSLCYFSKNNDVKRKMLDDELWRVSLVNWATSKSPRVKLTSAILLSVLLEDREIGMKLVQMLGIHSIMALVDDVIDVKIQHTVEKLLHQIQNQGNTKHNQFAKGDAFVIDEDLELYKQQ